MAHVIWNKAAECMDRQELAEMQLAKLKNVVKRCYESVPFYTKKFDEIGLKPEHIQTLKDIKEIPFTTADDLKNNYPFGLFAVPMKDVVRLHGSSGTTGKPKIEGYTRGDLDRWTETLARVISAAGVTDEDLVQISFGYGLFTGGFGLHYGMERVGATVLPLSSGNTERQLMMMKDLGTTVLVSTPSYALYMTDEMMKRGFKKEDFKLRVALFGGEGHTDAMRKKIEDQLGILATENYGLSEIGGPGYSGECYKKCGMHIAEDMFVSEIIDPDTLEPLNMGEKGELIVTPLDREAFPVLRYRTRDITWLDDSPCSCGRTSMRMAKVQGRSDDMLVIKGVNVFPSQIEEVMMRHQEVEPFYEIVVTSEGYMDNIEIRVEIHNTDLLEDFKKLETFRRKIESELRSMLNIGAKVTFVSRGTLPRFEGKGKRIVDKREK